MFSVYLESVNNELSKRGITAKSYFEVLRKKWRQGTENGKQKTPKYHEVNHAGRRVI